MVHSHYKLFQYSIDDDEITTQTWFNTIQVTLKIDLPGRAADLDRVRCNFLGCTEHTGLDGESYCCLAIMHLQQLEPSSVDLAIRYFVRVNQNSLSSRRIQFSSRAMRHIVAGQHYTAWYQGKRWQSMTYMEFVRVLCGLWGCSQNTIEKSYLTTVRLVKLKESDLRSALENHAEEETRNLAITEVRI